jgi:CRISPR-associated protein (TIGR03984 family)
MNDKTAGKQREIKAVRAILEEIDVQSLSQVHDWLAQQAKQHGLCWLLAHAYDGVIWGRLDDDRLVTSHDAAQGNPQAEAVCPPLRDKTLQQARLFGETSELLLWRDGDRVWNARLIRDLTAGETSDKTPAWEEAIDEEHLLWGTTPTALAEGFTLWAHGAQGLRHAVPYPSGEEPPKLQVRHYLARTDHTYIECSRLRGLDV